MRNLFRAAVAGILLGLGFCVPEAWPFVFFGFAYFLYTLRKAATYRAAARLGWIAGLFLYGLALGPIFFGTLPLSWFGVTSQSFGIEAATAVWLLCTIAFALGPLVFGVCWHWFTGRYAPSIRYLLVAPAAWVFTEWFGSFMFSVVSIGPGASLGSNFTFGALGYLLANDSALLQVAWLGGVYALSFLAAAIGVLIYLFIDARAHRTRMRYASALAALVMAILAGHLILAQARAGERIAQSSDAAISTAVLSRYVPPRLYITPEQTQADFDGLLDLIKPLRGVQLLVFPEDSAFLRMLDNGTNDIDSVFVQSAGVNRHSPLVVDSQDVPDNAGGYDERASFVQDGNTEAYSYKQKLVPAGEYIPYDLETILYLFGGAPVLRTVAMVRAYRPGPSTGMGIVNGAKVAVRFCDEESNPVLFQRQARAGANILVDLSSQSWFHGSRQVYHQMQLDAKVRAVENRRWFVQSGNMTPAFVLDAYGFVVGQTQWGKTQSLQTRVLPRYGLTPYSYAGQRVLWVVLALLLAGLLYKRRGDR